MVTIREAGHRLHVTVTSPHLAAQQEARGSFKALLPRHGQMCWLYGLKCWSIHRRDAAKVEAWAVGQGYRIVWDDGDDQTQETA